MAKQYNRVVQVIKRCEMPMSLNAADTRAQLIDPNLNIVGWTRSQAEERLVTVLSQLEVQEALLRDLQTLAADRLKALIPILWEITSVESLERWIDEQSQATYGK